MPRTLALSRLTLFDGGCGGHTYVNEFKLAQLLYQVLDLCGIESGLLLPGAGTAQLFSVFSKS